MNSNIAQLVRIEDIKELQHLDLAVSRTTLTPMPSSSTYETWIQDKEIKGVIIRKKRNLIAQRWFQPFEFFEEGKKKPTKAYWIHNTKIHPKCQNRGLYQRLADFCFNHLELNDYPLVSQISVRNKRMLHIAKRNGFERIGNLCLNAIIHMNHGSTGKNHLILDNSQDTKKGVIFRMGKWQLQGFPGETNVKWFWKDFDEMEGKIRLRIASPIHQTRNRLKTPGFSGRTSAHLPGCWGRDSDGGDEWKKQNSLPGASVLLLK